MSDNNTETTAESTPDTQTQTATVAKKVLYIGGHGKIALLATPMLVAAGHEVSSFIRSKEQVAEIEALGAHAVLGDITTTSVSQWAELFSGFDAVVWGAGNGGRGGSELTWAVDRDGALATIDALEHLQAAGGPVPEYIMISYLGATRNEADPQDGSWYAYVEAKKAVDKRLGTTDLDYLILGPAALGDEASHGIKVIPDDATGLKEKTSRELVAQVITEVLGRRKLPASPLAFVDGDNPVSSI